MLFKSFLINDFLRLFLLIFGQNKYISLRRYRTNFFHKTDTLKQSSKTYSFVYSKVYLIKATSKILLRFTKTI